MSIKDFIGISVFASAFLLCPANAQITLQSSSTGVLDSPRVGACDSTGTNACRITKTNLPLNSSTPICPAVTAPVTTEIYFSTAGVGISLSGTTLTQATVGTTAGSADLTFNTAGTLYTMPVPNTNAINAYGAAGVIVCIQKLRQ